MGAENYNWLFDTLYAKNTQQKHPHDAGWPGRVSVFRKETAEPVYSLVPAG